LHGSEVFAGAANVKGVDFASGVGEADFREAEADALVCAGDWENLVQFFVFMECEISLLAITLPPNVICQLCPAGGSVLIDAGAGAAPFCSL
jgi:hypothetical protein